MKKVNVQVVSKELGDGCYFCVVESTIGIMKGKKFQLVGAGAVVRIYKTELSKKNPDVGEWVKVNEWRHVR